VHDRGDPTTIWTSCSCDSLGKPVVTVNHSDHVCEGTPNCMMCAVVSAYAEKRGETHQRAWKVHVIPQRGAHAGAVLAAAEWCMCGHEQQTHTHTHTQAHTAAEAGAVVVVAASAA
jgi:hypothetical protein